MCPELSNGKSVLASILARRFVLSDKGPGETHNLGSGLKLALKLA